MCLPIFYVLMFIVYKDYYKQILIFVNGSTCSPLVCAAKREYDKSHCEIIYVTLVG